MLIDPLKKSSILLSVIGLSLLTSNVGAENSNASSLRGELESRDLQSEMKQPKMNAKLPTSADEWCNPPILPPLPYADCSKISNDFKVHSVPLFGGLTNALKMILLGTILSFEEDVCFYIDESRSPLLERRKSEESLDSIINRYFEPIGIPATDEKVVNAKKSNNIHVRDWREVWSNLDNRRMYGQTYNIKSLKYVDIEGHHLKRTMLRRMWRPLPHIRENTCAALGDHIQGKEFMTFSVRRGDKASVENFEYATAQQYIDQAEKAIPGHFDNTPPTIFVATDDCTVMEEFRQMRPNWKFVSECDKEKTVGYAGFALTDMTDWSKEDTDAHYAKFLIELYAMATAKYFIGVWYTNVSWWAQFMRHGDRSTFIMLDTPKTANFALDWN